MSKRRVVVIGAGTAGICAAKTARNYGLDVVVYEQSDKIGGTWNYTDRVGPDEFGLNYGYMYQGLITNVPKEIMGFSDLDVELDHSFMTQQEVLDYLIQYVQRFDVEKDVQFRHEVIRINPMSGNRWEVIVRDVVKNEFKTELFDFVMVCSGHHWDPRYPNIKGEETFQGSLKHSCTFRRKEDYAGQRVLVIGSGSSSIDIAVLLCDVCPEVIYSQHYAYKGGAIFPKNLRLVPDVTEITATGAVLQDGSKYDVDAIIYCTGFLYSYPFLSANCGIYVEDNHVQPLFKQAINIKYPTMAFIGLNFLFCIQLVVDLQCRFALNFWANDRPFPSKEEMLEDSQRELEIRLAKGWKKRHAHRLFDLQRGYCEDIAKLGEVYGIDEVYMRIFDESIRSLRINYQHYRKDTYTILDKFDFLKTSPHSNGSM